MTTIEIDKQESAAALCEAFAAALADEIGWTADGVSVKKDGISVYFTFIESNSSVYIGVSNGNATAQGGNSYYSYAKFDTSNTYRLYISQTTGGTIAVGIASTTISALGVIIARNTAGVYVGVALNGNNIYFVRGIDTSTQTMSSINSTSTTGCSTSIVKFPDIWGACMFSDLYVVISCPYTGPDCVFYINGENYRATVPNNTTGTFRLAIPEV